MEKIINYLGVDWGEKRIGLATSDSETKIAIPFKTLSSLQELLDVLIEEEINVIVLGSPQKMSGDEANNPKWLDFVSSLEKKSSCQLDFFDERLSSKTADSRSSNFKNMPKRDELAAAIILQDYLDSKS